MVDLIEGPLRAHRITYIREQSGTIPTAGTWEPFSDVVRNFAWGPDAGIAAQRGVGSPDPHDHVNGGGETHSFDLAYDLQGTVAQNKNPLYDGMVRGSDGEVLNSFGIVTRMEKTSGGAVGSGKNIYTVIRGAKIDDISIPLETDTEQPIQPSLTWQAQKVRSYEVSQPASEGTLSAVSSSANDTMNLTIESYHGTVSDTITLTGNTPVNTSSEFPNIDALWLASSPEGTIEVYSQKGGAGGGGTLLATIYGQNKYNDVEGNRGIPPGTHVTTHGAPFEYFLGNQVQMPKGTELAYQLASAELSISNNLDAVPQHNSLKPKIHDGERVIQLTASVIGENETHKSITRHLQNEKNNIWLEFSTWEATLESCAQIDTGGREISQGDVYVELDNTFEAVDIHIA